MVKTILVAYRNIVVCSYGTKFLSVLKRQCRILTTPEWSPQSPSSPRTFPRRSTECCPCLPTTPDHLWVSPAAVGSRTKLRIGPSWLSATGRNFSGACLRRRWQRRTWWWIRPCRIRQEWSGVAGRWSGSGTCSGSWNGRVRWSSCRRPEEWGRTSNPPTCRRPSPAICTKILSNGGCIYCESVLGWDRCMNPSGMGHYSNG